MRESPITNDMRTVLDMTKRMITLFASHLVAVGVGFAAGIYALPILIAPPAPDPLYDRASIREQ